MPTMASVYDYTFQCTALEGALQGSTSHADRVLVTRWHGVEALSRPYRFEITLAVARADLALETLLDQTATLTARVPGGDTRRWHGVITRAGEAGRDETHYYYQVVLEPRLARLRNMQWSDVYLKRDLADLIKQMLGHAGLTDTYSSEHSPYDYRIAATGLTRTQTEFTCQYEETCLDFLMRKLEYYGVYFWFEQGSDRESLVFANNITQQPSAADTAVYYPRGHQDPDARHIAITRVDRRVGLLPRTVVLHGHQDYANTSVTLTSQAEVPLPQAEKGLGEIHSGDDHFEQVEGDTQISGATLARWRAEELACGRLRAEGLARTPGIRAGRFLDVSEYHRAGEPRQYYVIEVEHEGEQRIETSARADGDAYRARFAALPRWLDPARSAQPLQFRPPRSTPVPQVTRLLNGFIDAADPRQPKRFAQPDAQGRYKVRFLFARQRYDGDRNSAFVRMATPYAGGASTQGLSNAGMHFPLREGTEVVLAFLRGDPDRPVIVAALPNVEAPSPVNVDNPGQHVIATPAGNSLIMADTQPGGTEDKPYIQAYSPVAESSLNLGTSSTSGVADGFALQTDGNGLVHAGTSMLIEVPGHLRMSAGGSDEVLAGFLSSVKSFAPGISGATTGGIVMTNFVGAKVENTAGVAVSNFLGVKAEMKESLNFDFNLSAKLAVDMSTSKVFTPFKKDKVEAAVSDVNVSATKVVESEKSVAATRNTLVGTWNTVATSEFELLSPNTAIGSPATAFMRLNVSGASLLGASLYFEAVTSTTIKSTALTTIEVGETTSLTMTPASATVQSTSVELHSLGDIEFVAVGNLYASGPLITFG